METRYPLNPDEFRDYFRYDFNCYEYEYPFNTFIDERIENERMDDFYDDMIQFYLTN